MERTGRLAHKTQVVPIGLPSVFKISKVSAHTASRTLGLAKAQPIAKQKTEVRAFRSVLGTPNPDADLGTHAGSYLTESDTTGFGLVFTC